MWVEVVVDVGILGYVVGNVVVLVVGVGFGDVVVGEVVLVVGV